MRRLDWPIYDRFTESASGHRMQRRKKSLLALYATPGAELRKMADA